MSVFSNERLYSIIDQSPILKKLTNSKTTNNVMEKRLVNNSSIRLRSSFVDPAKSRVRGLAARLIAIDEIQNVGMDHVPAILECAATFPTNKIIIFAGTPLSMENTIENYWSKKSSMCEWMTKCGCGKWNATTMKNIGVEGYVCEKCGKGLDIRLGTWVAGSSKYLYAGYHINQLMTPYTHKNWQSIHDKYHDYDLPGFMNEVLGESWDSGVKPITKAELIACCRDYEFERSPNPPSLKDSKIHVMGIDYGTGNVSYTVVTILTLERDGTYKLSYMKRYAGLEASEDFFLQDITELCHLWNCRVVCADWGFGVSYNFNLQKRIGKERVIPVYFSAAQKDKISFDKHGGGMMVVHRSRVLSDVFTLFKNQEMIAPYKSDPEKFITPFGQDILNECIEESKTDRLKYIHDPDNTDDCLFSITLAYLAAQMKNPRLDMHVVDIPGKSMYSKKEPFDHNYN